MGKTQFWRFLVVVLCLLLVPFTSWVIAQTAPLKPPAGVQAAPGNGTVTLSWQAATGAKLYQVFMSDSADGLTSPIATTSDLSLFFQSLPNGRKFYFAVKSVRGSEKSALSNVVSAVPAPPPAAPSLLGITPQIGALSLKWGAVSGAQSYWVFRSEVLHKFDFTTPLTKVSGSTLTYTDFAVRPATRYYYVVRTVNPTGQSLSSPEVSGIPKVVPTPTPKPTVKPTATPTPKPTVKPTATATPKPTVKPTATATPKPSTTPTPKPGATATPKPTAKPQPTATPKPTATPQPTTTATPVIFWPTSTPLPAPTATPTAGPTAEPTATSTPAPTATPVPTATPFSTATSVPTATPAPTATSTSVPTATPEPTATATPVPTATPDPAATATPTPAPTATPAPTPYPMPNTGVYRITTRGQQSMALDVVGFGLNDGAVVQMWDAASTCNQQWLVEKTADGNYRIHAYGGNNSTEMLDLTNGKTDNGTTVKLYHDNGNSAQTWILKPVGDGYYRIIPQNAGATSNQTLDMSNGNGATRGSTTAIYPYFGGNNQVFRFDDPGTLQPTPGVYVISSKIAPALAFDVDGFKNANGTDVLLWNNTSGANQQWLLETGGGNIYKVSAYRGVNSFQVLDYAGGNTANGTSVTTYEDTGSVNQQWFFKLTDGYYRIIPQKGGWDGAPTLDVRGGTSATLGSRLNVYQYTGGANQLFTLTVPTKLLSLGSAKKGIGGRPDAVDPLGCSWFYNWGGERPPATRVPLSSEFVPMMWGYYGGDGTDYVNFMKGQPGAKTLLAFNEPDHTDQANISVDRALEGYQYLANAGVPIGSPACADALSGWMQDFMNKANAKGYRVDYVTVHAYQRDPWSFLWYVDEVYRRFGKPVWVTEFAPTDWGGTDGVTDAEAMNYMKIVLPELAKRSYVQRYAWYSGADHGTWTLGPAALVEYEGGPLTPLGKLYARY